MDHDFDVVEQKVAETEFFLGKMARAGSNMFEFQCYLSAFLASSRTSTLALQQFKHVEGFEEWYSKHRESLKQSSMAKFFLDLRNAHLHGGQYPVKSGIFYRDTARYEFRSTESRQPVPSSDILASCRKFFILILEIVHDCYVELGPNLDSQQYFTKEHFSLTDRSIDDAEIEVFGWICEHLIEEEYDDDARWSELRGNVYECSINHLFYSYLGKVTPQPVEPDHYVDFAYTPEERGWIHPPAGYSSVEEYWAESGIQKPDYHEP
ncbi:hypothetical protein [Pseudomonas sp. GCEP-101]|uniref:hypothetical protein n=1 Tax=Pseudomonas sp. GCEP-101 TaxID=2974552 RepID=UPI00223ADF71|nr:hypothetical protein [Pseudomonas sp. GCEP-101]